MRNGQNKRMRGRNRKSQNPLTRVYESNGPDVKIRGTAPHVAEKYLQLARDAQGSGDPVAAENYYQHAEHYFRMIAAANEQFRQTQPFFRPDGDNRDDMYEDGDEEAGHPMMGSEPGYGAREPERQSYAPREQQPREQQPYQRREQQPFGTNEPQPHGRPAPTQTNEDGQEVERLPSFITGGQQPGPHQPANGHGHEAADRFPLHRRRRRHRGPRGEVSAQAMGDDDGAAEPHPIAE
jgi:hypothetical protein